MTTSDSVMLGLAWLVGTALGAFFFGGLHWTVRRGLTARLPALWFLGSMLLRTAVTLTGFYLSSRGSWQRLAACVFGFVVGRMLTAWLLREQSDRRTHSTGEAPNAPEH